MSVVFSQGTGFDGLRVWLRDCSSWLEHLAWSSKRHAARALGGLFAGDPMAERKVDTRHETYVDLTDRAARGSYAAMWDLANRLDVDSVTDLIDWLIPDRAPCPTRTFDVASDVIWLRSQKLTAEARKQALAKMITRRYPWNQPT